MVKFSINHEAPPPSPRTYSVFRMIDRKRIQKQTSVPARKSLSQMGFLSQIVHRGYGITHCFSSCNISFQVICTKKSTMSPLNIFHRAISLSRQIQIFIRRRCVAALHTFNFVFPVSFNDLDVYFIDEMYFTDCWSKNLLKL